MSSRCSASAAGAAELEPPAGDVGRVGRQHRERVVVEAGRAAPDLGVAGALGGHLEDGQRSRRDVVGDALDRPQLPQQAGRGSVVVGDAFDGGAAVLGGSARGEPVAQGRVAAGPFRLGQRRVGDVADHLGRERVLVVAELDEVALGQEVEGDLGVEGVVAPGGELADRVERAAGADDGAVLQHVALGRPERVEPRRHQSLQGRGEVPGSRAARDRARARPARLAEQRGELLDEERVAAAALVQEGDDVLARVLAQQLGRPAPRPRRSRAARGRA